MQVSYQLSGNVEQLPPGSAEAIQRVIQEAITNALKHAPGAAIAIELHGRDDVVELGVHNPRLLAAPAIAAGLGLTGGGQGIAGMRERVQRYGGDFQAGPDGNGGWHVSAGLPLRVQVPRS